MDYKDLQDQMKALLSNGYSREEILKIVKTAPTIFKYTKCGVEGILDSLPPEETISIKRPEIFNFDLEAAKNNIAITPIEDIIEKILKHPDSFYEKICEELAPEERLFIIQNLENKSCMNCTNSTCRVPYAEKTGVDESDKPQGSQCIGWSNEVLIGKCKVFKKNNLNNSK